MDPPPVIPPPVPGRVLDDAEEWEYFGEGAANVLYRYVGADSFFVRLPTPPRPTPPHPTSSFSFSSPTGPTFYIDYILTKA